MDTLLRLTGPLRTQHVEILFHVQAVEAAVAAGEADDARAQLDQLRPILIEHFAAEAAEIVPVFSAALTGGTAAEAYAIGMNTFISRLDWVRTSFLSLLQRHRSGPRPEASFQSDWTAFAELLRDLIDLEEERIYPLYESLEAEQP